MKQGKANTAKKKTTKPSTHTTKPKVREVKAKPVDKDFVDVDEGTDNRLIVFVAIAILVILATIIGLLVGCEKNKEPEPEKPIDEIVVPEKEDKDNGVVTREIVRKVKSTYSSKKKTSTTSTPTYTVTIYFNDEPTTQDVKKGETINDEAPKGYSTCTYYTDEDMTEEFDPSTGITGETNLFMTCEVMVYTVTYDPEGTNNPGTYTVEDNDTELEAAPGDNFQGWFAEDGTEVKSLNSSVIDLADGERVIKLTAKFGEVTGETSDDETDDTADDTDAVTTNMADGTETLDGDSESGDAEGDGTGGRRALVLEDPLEEEPKEEDSETVEPNEEENKEEDKIVAGEEYVDGDKELEPPKTDEVEEKKDDEEDKKETQEPTEPEVKEPEEKEPVEEEKKEEPKEEPKPVEEPKVPEKEVVNEAPKVEKPVEPPVVDTEPTEDE